MAMLEDSVISIWSCRAAGQGAQFRFLNLKAHPGNATPGNPHRRVVRSPHAASLDHCRISAGAAETRSAEFSASSKSFSFGLLETPDTPPMKLNSEFL